MTVSEPAQKSAGWINKDLRPKMGESRCEGLFPAFGKTMNERSKIREG